MPTEEIKAHENTPLPDVSSLLMDLYKDDCTQARHHEAQRSSMTSIIVAVSAGLIAFIAHGKNVTHAAWMPCSLLIFLGLFGALFSAKQYERARRHGFRAKAYRVKLDSMYPTAQITTICKDADQEAQQEFPCLFQRRLHHFWIGLNLFISLLGAIILFQALK